MATRPDLMCSEAGEACFQDPLAGDRGPHSPNPSRYSADPNLSGRAVGLRRISAAMLEIGRLVAADQRYNAGPEPGRSVQRFRALTLKFFGPAFARRVVHLAGMSLSHHPGQEARCLHGAHQCAAARFVTGRQKICGRCESARQSLMSDSVPEIGISARRVAASPKVGCGASAPSPFGLTSCLTHSTNCYQEPIGNLARDRFFICRVLAGCR
jgi:hypothetical protein